MSMATEKDKAAQIAKRTLRKTTNLLDLPKETVLGISRLIVLGREEILIENHGGIIDYSSERIRISSKPGSVMIDGSGLLIRSIGSERIHIEGNILAILFE
jgi:sporulation protein YqfC